LILPVHILDTKRDVAHCVLLNNFHTQISHATKEKFFRISTICDSAAQVDEVLFPVCTWRWELLACCVCPEHAAQPIDTRDKWATGTETVGVCESVRGMRTCPRQTIC